MIDDFTKGLVTFGSPKRLQGFTRFENVDNTKRNRIEKVRDELQKTANVATEYTSLTPQGQGFFSYRTEYNAAGAQTSTLWYLMYVPIIVDSGTHINTGGGSITDVATSFDIDDATLVNDESYIKIEKEYMKITNIAGATITVVRAQLGSTGATHADLTTIYNVVWKLVRYDNADGTGGSWSTVLKHEINQTWNNLLNPADIDFYVYNGALRISDGQYANTGVSQWYGYIKRSIFGQGLTYGESALFSQPSQAASIAAWTLKSQAISAPTVTPMQYAFDYNNEIGTAGEIGICIHYPPASGSSETTILDQIDPKTFKNGDKYTATFVYDNLQESELGKNGNIVGVKSYEDAQTTTGIVPAIQIVVNTASWNNRISGINLYWQPEDSIEWFLVTSFDIDKCWTDDQSSLKTSVRQITNGEEASNMGAWIPCPDMDNKRNSGNGILLNTNSTNLLYNTDNGAGVEENWTTTYGLVAGDLIILELSAISATMANTLTMVDSKIGMVTSITDGAGVKTDANLAYKGLDHIDLYPGSADIGNGSAYDKAYAAAKSTTKIAHWYVPNTGARTTTYQSRNAREESTKLITMRWRTSDISDEGMVVVGNVDTQDEQAQTVRERSRIFWNDPGLADVFTWLNTRDIGRDDGDVIQSVRFWNDNWYIIKDRNTYVYSKNMGQRLKTYPGYGAQYRHAVAKTPYGICISDLNQISLLQDTPLEMTLPWREDYQDLTFSNPVLSYSAITDELYFINDTSEDDAVLYKYSFSQKSWRQETLGDNVVISNLILGNAMEPLAGFHSTGDTAQIKEFNTGSASTDTAVIKKRYDYGDPNIYKSLRSMFCTYMTDPWVDSGDVVDGDPGGINATDTTVSVDSVAQIAVNQPIKLDNEVMLVTAINSLTLTIVRGVGGTTAASHSNGKEIYLAADDLTIKVYFDGNSTAYETITFGASGNLINFGIKPSGATPRKFKTIDIEMSCAGESLIVEDITPIIEPMGKKLS